MQDGVCGRLTSRRAGKTRSKALAVGSAPQGEQRHPKLPDRSARRALGSLHRLRGSFCLVQFLRAPRLPQVSVEGAGQVGVKTHGRAAQHDLFPHRVHRTHALNPLLLSNDVRLYNLIMRCAWETLDQLARQPQWLGAQTGMLAILHTWGQKLDFHPHIHCVVPGGGVLPDGNWKPAKKGFFVPVRVMSALFRGKFLAALKQMRQTGGLEYHGSAAALADDIAFKSLLCGLYKTGWVVYAKAPMGGPAQVLKYLGRYTHRIAISNRRILGIAEGKVTFSYKTGRIRTATK